jgi:hypothetical protein
LGQGTESAGPFGRFAKLFAAVTLLIAVGAAASLAWRGGRDRRLLHTGPARWIWYTREIQEPAPLSFRAWRIFRLDADPPATAPARFFVDREGWLEVNGARLAGGTQRPGDPLRLLDLAPFLRKGDNRISIGASSPDGVGGILFWMDPGGGRVLVSDESWRVERLPSGTEPPRAAAVWGRPPLYPWGYPPLPER